MDLSYHKTKKRARTIQWTVLLFFLFFNLPFLYAQFTITENFKGSVSSDIIIGDNAYLTSGVNDPVGAGWLRLTTDDQDRKGYAYINKTFPSTLGLLVDFEYKMWRTKDGRGGLNQGGDGFSVYLFDGNTSTADFALGGYGGSLGYTRNRETTPGTPGLKNGYLGIGFDAFGNFINKNSPAKFTGSNGGLANSIVLRGKTTAADNATSNIYLKGINISGTGKGTITGIPADFSGTNSSNGWQNHLDYNKSSGTSTGSYPSSRPNDEIFYRRVQIEIIPITGGMYKVTLRWMREGETSFTELMSYNTTDVPPAILKVGFAASTGWAVNFHEIRNLLVTTPGNLRVSKRANKDILRTVASNNENLISYTIDVVNDTDATLTNINFKDKITDGATNLITPDMFTITGISHSGFSAGTSLPATSATNEFTGSLNLAPRTTGKIIVTGTLKKVPVGNLLVNTATALPTDITDEDLENNTSVVRTPVIAENVDLLLQKQTIGNPCIDAVNGNSYELRVVNMGNANATYTRLGTNNVNRIVVYKDVPAGYTYNDSSTNYTTSTATTGTQRWYRTIENLSGGITRYIYVARGAANSTQTLSGNGTFMEPDYPIRYTIKPPAGTASYNDVATVEYVSVTNGVNSYKGTNIESSYNPPNTANNTHSETVYAIPPAPVVPNTTVYYCLGEQATALEATPTNAGYRVVWYSSLGGAPLNNAPVPVTNNAGTISYYVAQTNGTCEGPQTEIRVIVRPAPTSGSIAGDQRICSGSAPQQITSNQAGTTTDGGTISYRWEASTDNGVTWQAVSGTGITFQAGKTNRKILYRRFTLSTLNNKSCESNPTNTVTIDVKICKVITNPMMPGKARQP